MQFELKLVSYCYSPSTPYAADALHHINLEIRHGECIGITGETGSGRRATRNGSATQRTATARNGVSDGRNRSMTHATAPKAGRRNPSCFFYVQASLRERPQEQRPFLAATGSPHFYHFVSFYTAMIPFCTATASP